MTASTPETTNPRVIVLHENPEWWPPFQEAFDAAGVPVEPWLLVDGQIDLGEPPPEATYWSRISASAHTRDHLWSKEYARSVLSWLEGHGRTVVNGRRAIEIEMSKVHQLARLRAAGIDVPRTTAVIGDNIEALRVAARPFADAPFILKHNQGGKGLGVRRFDSLVELDSWLDGPSDDREVPVDGITLVQEYLRPAGGFITRAEFVGGEFIYALQADTVHGGFQLCPADACAIDPETGRPVIPPGAERAPEPGQQIFSLRTGFDHPILQDYRAFLAAEDIGIAGVEFIETADGRLVTYDVNTNTNYNPDVEAAVRDAGGVGGPASITSFLASIR